MVAQGAHASLGAVLKMQYQRAIDPKAVNWDWDAYDEWTEGQFSKICVGCDSEAELLRIYNEASDAGLPVKLITDSGRTEFHGVPTKTCLAIGPAWADEIDKITGELKLL